MITSSTPKTIDEAIIKAISEINTELGTTAMYFPRTVCKIMRSNIKDFLAQRMGMVDIYVELFEKIFPEAKQ